MANPFYPPRRGEHGDGTRGNVPYEQQTSAPFDPDRRTGVSRGGATGAYDDVDRYAKQQQPHQQQQRLGNAGHDDDDHEDDDDDDYQRRQTTDGPGGASSFYPPQYDYESSGQAKRQQNGSDDYPSSDDYGARYNDSPRKPAQLLPVHAVYENRSAQNSQVYMQQQHDQAPTRGYYSAENAARHQYPPPNAGYAQSSSADLRAPLAPGLDRPDTPGIYRDRAPRMEKLTPQQRKIVAQFPKDLDEEGGSLISTVVRMCKDWRSFMRWKYVHYYILTILLCAVVALMTIYHKQIVDWLTPLSKKVRELSWGWIIPVAILFVLSFPPLFGHEIIGVLCGIVYGLWIGFGILSLGTLLGELGNFYAFKYFLKKHGERYERKSIDYACMAYIVREGGFMIILLARLSAIPGHFTTAVFATVGMNVFVFTIAAILSLPKQLVVVYLGVALEQAGSGGTESTRSKVIKYVVLIVSFLVTVGVAVFLYDKMHKARPTVRERMRERRFRMLTDAAGEADGEVSGGQNAEAHSASLGHSKVPSDGDEPTQYHLNGLAYDDSATMNEKPTKKQKQKQQQEQKRGSAWTRWMRSQKGKDVERDQETRGGGGQPDMAMHNVAPMSYEREHVEMYQKYNQQHGGQAAPVARWNDGRDGQGGMAEYDDETLRPTARYGDQYPHRQRYDVAQQTNAVSSSSVELDRGAPREREPSGPYAM